MIAGPLVCSLWYIKLVQIHAKCWVFFRMHTPFVKSAEQHVNPNSRQMNKTFILSVVAGIIALIVLIYINDMLFPILNAQLGLFIAATVICAAIVVIFRQKSIQRRNGVFKRIKVIDFCQFTATKI